LSKMTILPMEGSAFSNAVDAIRSPDTEMFEV